MSISVPFIRLNEGTLQQWRLPDDTDVHQLHPAFDSLNQLGSCPWVINKPVSILDLSSLSLSSLHYMFVLHYVIDGTKLATAPKIGKP